MLGLSWTELMVIGVVALVVIGPKDLPIMMRRIGEFAGQVRRMGGEFQRELQRAAAIDELKDLRKSVTDPIRQANAEITRQFNKITPTGVQPSGVLAPTDPKAESVVDAIKAQAGMTGPSAPAGPAPAPVAPSVPSAKASPMGEGAVTNPAFALSPPPKVKPTPPPAPEAAAPEGMADAAPAMAAKPKRARKPKATALKAQETAPSETVSSADVPPVAVEHAAKPVRARRAPAKAAATAIEAAPDVEPARPARKSRTAKVG